jgi:hypothetical protein
VSKAPADVDGFESLAELLAEVRRSSPPPARSRRPDATSWTIRRLAGVSQSPAG